MASAVASVGHHPALSSSIRDGSSLASDSGFCDNHVSVAVSPKFSLSVNHRNRFASVRALRRFQQRSSAFPKSVCVPSKCQCRNNKVMTFCAKQRGFLSSNLLQSVDVCVSHGEFLNNKTGSVRLIRARAVSGESQAVGGEEGKGEPASTNEKPTSSGTSTPSPFAAGKISSKIASKTSQQAENGKSSSRPATNKAPATATTVSKGSTNLSTSKPAPASTPSVFAKAPTTKPSFAVKPKSLIDDGSDGAFPTGKVSPFAADRLKSQMSSPPSQYNRTSSGRTMINSGKQVLDAFKQGEKDGKTTKFGQPIVPKNIFDDVRQTQEEKDADKFSFNLRPGDIFLVFSFLLIIGLMLGTAFIVWKVGAIHYNE